MEWKVKRIVLSWKENGLKKTYFLTVLFENILIRFYTRNPCCALNELPNYKLSDLESNYIFKAINVFLLPSIRKSSYHHRNTQPNLLVYYWILTHCSAIQYADFLSENQVQWGPASNSLVKLLFAITTKAKQKHCFFLV